jgi:hypothetical protein
MLGQVAANYFSYFYSLTLFPATTPGVAVTPAAGSKGNYAVLASSANLLQDVYGMSLWVHSGNTTGTVRDILLDIGIDPAGGTTYAQQGGINNIFVPQCALSIEGGRAFYFPIFIESGSSIGARAQASDTSTVTVVANFYGQPSHPELVQAGSYSETVGVSGNGGTPLAIGLTGGDTAWTSIGSTTRDCWHWTLAAGHNVNTTTARVHFVSLAYGSATAPIYIIRNQVHYAPGTAEKSGNFLSPYAASIHPVPSGSALYVKALSSGTSGTMEAVAVGIGG